jgi:hypothetical protein
MFFDHIDEMTSQADEGSDTDSDRMKRIAARKQNKKWKSVRRFDYSREGRAKKFISLETKDGDVNKMKTPRGTNLQFSTIELSSSYSSSTANVSFSEPSETPRKEFERIEMRKLGKNEVQVISQPVEEIISTINKSINLQSNQPLGENHPPEALNDIQNSPGTMHIPSKPPRKFDSNKTLPTISTSIESSTPRPSSFPLSSSKTPQSSTQTPRIASTAHKPKLKKSKRMDNCRSDCSKKESAFR